MNKKSNISAFTIIVIFLAVALAGAVLVPLLPVKLAPSRTLPELSIRFSMARSSARIVEMEATSKLEAMLSRVKGVKKISSISGNGYGEISLELDKHTPIDMARFEASTIIRQTWAQLPASVSYPQLSARRPDEKAERPFLNYTLNSSVQPITIQKYAEDVIKPRLSEIAGIYKVTVRGATPMEWQLQYDMEQLRSIGVTVNDIRDAINKHEQTQFLGMGEVNTANNTKAWMRVVLKSNAKQNGFDAKSIMVTNKNGRMLRLNQLVTVKHTPEEPRGYYRINGLNSIYISIVAEPSSNQLELSNQITELMQQIKANLPNGYELHKSYDASEYIRAELKKIYFRTGLTILILLLFVFLITRNLKYLFLIVTSLTVNLAVATILYYFLKLEIQIYSLAGITISLSLVIDNTIIMADHLMHKKNRQVFLPVLAATLTTVGALSIVFFLKEELRLNLQDFAAVVMINLMVSLLVALFFVPAMVEKIKLKKQVSQKRFYKKTKRIVVRLTNVYRRVISVLSRRKWLVYTTFILLFGLPVFMLPKKIEGEGFLKNIYNKTIGSSIYQDDLKPYVDKALGGTLRLFVNNVFEGSYFSRNSETVLSVSASMPNGTTLKQMNNLVQKMESFLTGFPQIKQFQTSIYSPLRANIRIYFTPKSEKTAFPYQLKSSIISKAIVLGGGSWSVYGLQDRGFSNNVRETAGSMRIKLLGYNYDELTAWADTLKSDLLAYRRIQEVTISSRFSWYKSDYSEFYFDLNKQQLAIKNIDASSLFRMLNDTYAKNLLVGNALVNGDSEQIKLSSKQANTHDIWMLKNGTHRFSGSSYKMSNLATIVKGKSPQEIARENQQYKLAIQYSYVGSSSQGDRILKREIKRINQKLPMGYTAQQEGWSWRWGNDNKKQYWLLLLLLVIIFFTTSVLFNSLRQPFVVILVIPVAFIGVFLTFFLFDLNFDQGGFAAFVLLSGITVNASIYILNEYNGLSRRKQHNNSSMRLYLKAWNSKIIPILLTIISTILGFIPFLIGVQKEAFWFPLAAGTIGGLIFSVVGIFFLLPMLVVDKQKRGEK